MNQSEQPSSQDHLNRSGDESGESRGVDGLEHEEIDGASLNSQLSIQLRLLDITNMRSSSSSSNIFNVSNHSELIISKSDTSNLDSLDSSWSNEDDNCNDVEGCSTDSNDTKKHNHFGKDLSGFSDDNNNYCGLMSDFSQGTALKTTSVVTRIAFIIGSTNSLNMMALQRRFILDMDGPITFMESLQLCQFQQCGRGSVVAFRLLSSSDWKLGIVKSIFPMNHPPVAGVFEWTGRVSSPGIPEFVNREMIVRWSDISSHFSLREFSPDELELVFVNQVRGIPIGNNPISNST